MKLIPFDVEAAKNGARAWHAILREEVKFLFHAPEAREDYRVAILTPNGEVWTYTEDGKSSSTADESLFLIAPEPKTLACWVNVYTDGRRLFVSPHFYGYEEAQNAAPWHIGKFVKTVKIEVEVDE